MNDPVRYVKVRMVVFYHENELKPVPFPCTRCGKTIFVTNREILSVVNTHGVPFRDIPTGNVFIEIPCGFCKTLHRVIFQ